MEPVRVLIVDDEEELVSALTERLELRGFIASGATSGEEALNALGGRRCDVVVVDIRMPGLGGLELTRQIRTEHPATAVVLLTGRLSADDAEEGYAAGAFEYLAKPVPIETLERVLRAAAGRTMEEA
ncbi:MAG: response regulator [Gemmatimonadota bacterium]